MCRPAVHVPQKFSRGDHELQIFHVLVRLGNRGAIVEHQGRAGDQTPRGAQTVRDRVRVVVGLHVALTDATQQEHVVVHRQAEQNREHAQR